MKVTADGWYDTTIHATTNTFDYIVCPWCWLSCFQATQAPPDLPEDETQARPQDPHTDQNQDKDWSTDPIQSWIKYGHCRLPVYDPWILQSRCTSFGPQRGRTPSHRETLVTWSNIISVRSDFERTLLFISFHPWSSIQYNMCYERKYFVPQCCHTIGRAVPFASAARNQTLQFLYKLFYNFWQAHPLWHLHWRHPIMSTKFLGNW